MNLATLSNTSPAASSTVEATIFISLTELARYMDVCPPETTSPAKGKAGFVLHKGKCLDIGTIAELRKAEKG
jgi:hypothetical protein